MATIQKWGNSLGVRIPRDIAADLGFTAGKQVTLEERDGELAIRPVKGRTYPLKELLKGMTPANMHKEIDWGPPQGREIW